MFILDGTFCTDNVDEYRRHGGGLGDDSFLKRSVMFGVVLYSINCCFVHKSSSKLLITNIRFMFSLCIVNAHEKFKNTHSERFFVGDANILFLKKILWGSVGF